MVTVPHYGDKYPFTPFGVFIRAASLQGIFLGSAAPNTFLRQILDFYRQGLFPHDRLIRTCPFEEINRAMEDTHSCDVV